ncbi:MAG: S-layer homology domain-containing protein [Clostridia bacterium]|nr:S-layer homology domain-containing protein [Clostridia bacterium]
MKKVLCLCLVLAMILSCLPILSGAGAICYSIENASAEWVLSSVEGTTFVPTIEKTATAVFTAPGNGTVTIPETTVSATGNDGARVRILKGNNEVLSYLDVQGKTEVPALELHVTAGETITFEADARAMGEDRVSWAVSLSYVGGVAEAEALINFIDLNNHWAKSYVIPLAEEGIVKGKTPNTFDPDGQITRAEFLTLALKVANLPTEIYLPSYTDVTETQWFAKVAHTAQKADILAPEMVVNNQLLPDAPILREEMTAIIMRLIAVMRGTTVDPAHTFTDGATFAPWANDYIGKAAKLGIVTGNPDGSFNAKGSATRGEAAVMFSRLKKFLADTPLYTPAGEYSPVYDAIVYEDVDLHKMINDAYAAGQKEITIAPGAYRIKSSPKGGHIRLEGAKDFTINGEGVTLLLQTGATSAFVLNNCENVRINGFNVDWEKGMLFQGQIYNFDPDGYYFDFTIEPGYPSDLKKLSASMMGSFYDRDTHELVIGTETFNLRPTQIEQLGSNTYRLNAKSIAGQKELKVGDYLCARAYANASTVHLYRSKNCAVVGMNIWGGLCSLTDTFGEGGTLYQDIKNVCGPMPLGAITPRMVSTQGDGVHCTALRKGPKIINCVFENQLDDGTNIHGSFGKVYEVKGDTIVVGLHSKHTLYWQGDDIRFYNPTTEENTQAFVKEAKALENYTPLVNLNENVGSVTFAAGKYFEVTLEKGKKNYKVGDWVINRDWTSSDFEIRDCVFRNSRSRSLLVKSSNGVIENCDISLGAMYGLWIAPEFDWTESGYVENVVVRNCTFYKNGWVQVGHSGGLTVSGGEGIGQDHHNVTIENCTFYDNYNLDLHMSEGTDFVIRNNTFKNSTQNAAVCISLDNATNVTLSGNTFGEGRTNIKVSDSVSNLKEL